MPKKILVVGGVAGGASFAARARRLDEQAEIIVFEKSGYVSFANCGMPYHLGAEIEKRESLLLQTPQSLHARLNIDVRIYSEVISINRGQKSIEIKDLKSNKTYTENYDYLLLAPGAQAIIPALPGIDSAPIQTLRNIEDLDRIIAWIKDHQPKSAVIIGAGFIGLEVAEQLHKSIPQITIIEALNQVLAPLDPEMAILLEHELVKHKIRVLKNDPLSHFSNTSGFQAHTKSGQVIAADLAILSIGVRPDITLAKNAGLEIGNRGGIKVNNFLQTSDPFIYAVGDAIEVKNIVTGEYAPIPLAGPANRQARLAADNILYKPQPYQGTLGTAIARVFTLAAASTGANEKTLQRLNTNFEVLYLYPNSHAAYYPGAKELCMKILFDKISRKLLGAQIVGSIGVDKRIDLLATAIKGNLTIDQLADLELSYAPPYGSAKDPVNMAGMAAQNIADEICENITPKDLDRALNSGAFLLDVRNESEVSQGKIPGSFNIPLNNLRDNLSKLPKDQEIIVYCASAQRSYYACRILKQNLFKVRNLTGAFKIWSQFNSAGLI